jgi:tetratricopeptide repeat protein 30
MARPMTGMAMPKAPQTGMRTAMGTSAGSGGGFGSGAIREGKYTEQIYGMIRDGKYAQAIDVLSTKLLEFPTSRSAASLLAYCYYHRGDFQNALQMYERLMRM